MPLSPPYTTATSFPELLPLGIYTLLALVIITVMLLASWWFGARKPGKNKAIAYESGLIPTGNAQFAHPVPFYLVAIFFIVFDVEAVFIFTWAVAWDELGLPGLIHITAFITILLAGLAWLWIKGGLDWGPSRERDPLEQFQAKGCQGMGNREPIEVTSGRSRELQADSTQLNSTQLN